MNVLLRKVGLLKGLLLNSEKPQLLRLKTQHGIKNTASYRRKFKLFTVDCDSTKMFLCFNSTNAASFHSHVNFFCRSTHRDDSLHGNPPSNGSDGLTLRAQ